MHLQSATGSSRDERFPEGRSEDRRFLDGAGQEYAQQINQDANQWRHSASPHQIEYQSEFADYRSMPNYDYHDTRNVQSDTEHYDTGHQFSSNDRALNHGEASDSFHQHFSANRDSREGGVNENSPGTYEYLSANEDRNGMNQNTPRIYQQLYTEPESLHVENFDYEHQHLSGSFSDARQWQQPGFEHTSDWNAERKGDDIAYNDHLDVLNNSSNRLSSQDHQQNNEQQKVDHNQLDHNQNELAAKENAQLKILYDARGRKIEELQKSFSEKIEELEKEIRVLQHRLTLVTGNLSCYFDKNSLNEFVIFFRNKGCKVGLSIVKQ